MEKDLVEIHISFNDLIIYECVGVEKNMKATKDESKDEEHIEKVPRLINMDIRKRKWRKYKDEYDEESEHFLEIIVVSIA